LIVTALGDPSHELEFINQVLRVDSKNYHTWVYRQWVLAHFGGISKKSQEAQNVREVGADQYPDLWRGELDYIDTLLSQDVRNNSAWNHRYFCIFGSGWAQSEQGQCREWWKLGNSLDEVLKSDVAFTKGHIITVPNNASAWNYLRG
jgi:protein farnesyltransferase/geranylgeranyltransferase type-1 subunit alpha